MVLEFDSPSGHSVWEVDMARRCEDPWESSSVPLGYLDLVIQFLPVAMSLF